MKLGTRDLRRLSSVGLIGDPDDLSCPDDLRLYLRPDGAVMFCDGSEGVSLGSWSDLTNRQQAVVQLVLRSAPT